MNIANAGAHQRSDVGGIEQGAMAAKTSYVSHDNNDFITLILTYSTLCNKSPKKPQTLSNSDVTLCMILFVLLFSAAFKTTANMVCSSGLRH